MKNIIALVCFACFAAALAAQPQPQPPPPPGGPPGPPPRAPQGPPPGPGRDMRLGPPGMWWNDAALAQKIGISPEQQKKMADVFQQNRLRLIDLNAAVQKEEAILDPLMQADQPDDAKILAQIDRVAQARAELEKGRAKMLLEIRHVLTPEQWHRLQAENIPPPGRGPRGDGPQPRRPQEE